VTSPAQPPPWRCPVCRDPLQLPAGERRLACAGGHSFDLAREGYVNLLVDGRRRSRTPGDSNEMVAARRRFLATRAYGPVSEALALAVAGLGPGTLLDVGCGEGHHTRIVAGSLPPQALVLGIDVAKPAVAAAARAHRAGWYAVASAADLPLPEARVDVALDVFGPVMPEELARAVRPGGAVVAAHPGPEHLEELRRLVYESAHPHELKPPLRHASESFEMLGSEAVRFPLTVADAVSLGDLFTMTPYRWHAPPDMGRRLEAAAEQGFETVVDIRITVYQRR
jgi:23S rRNA (guanine745-N1)-methyltransferase